METRSVDVTEGEWQFPDPISLLSNAANHCYDRKWECMWNGSLDDAMAYQDAERLLMALEITVIDSRYPFNL